MLNKQHIESMYRGEVVRSRTKSKELTDDFLIKLVDYLQNHKVTETARHFNISDALVRQYKVKARKRGLV